MQSMARQRTLLSPYLGASDVQGPSAETEANYVELGRRGGKLVCILTTQNGPPSRNGDSLESMLMYTHSLV